MPVKERGVCAGRGKILCDRQFLHYSIAVNTLSGMKPGITLQYLYRKKYQLKLIFALHYRDSIS